MHSICARYAHRLRMTGAIAGFMARVSDILSSSSWTFGPAMTAACESKSLRSGCVIDRCAFVIMHSTLVALCAFGCRSDPRLLRPRRVYRILLLSLALLRLQWWLATLGLRQSRTVRVLAWAGAIVTAARLKSSPLLNHHCSLPATASQFCHRARV